MTFQFEFLSSNNQISRVQWTHVATILDSASLEHFHHRETLSLDSTALQDSRAPFLSSLGGSQGRKKEEEGRK